MSEERETAWVISAGVSYEHTDPVMVVPTQVEADRWCEELRQFPPDQLEFYDYMTVEEVPFLDRGDR